MKALDEREGSVLMRVRVQPKASRNAIVAEPDGRLAAQAEGGHLEVVVRQAQPCAETQGCAEDLRTGRIGESDGIAVGVQVGP